MALPNGAKVCHCNVQSNKNHFFDNEKWKYENINFK